MIPIAMFMPGPMELGVILLIVVIFFGAGKIPTVMADVGKGFREFRKAVKEVDEVNLLEDSER
jgi:sec-independent protein translocase protein TatA